MTTAYVPKLAELTGEYKLDAAHSRIGFVARHAMVTKVRGAFNDFEGEGYLDGANPANSNVKVTIKTESIDTRNGQRDGHLRTNDFLDVPNYPEITFVSTAVRQLDDSTFELTGDLKIKDVTKSIAIPLEYQGAATDPFGSSARRLRGRGQHQPRRLRHHLERRARDRRRTRQRQDRPRVRGLRGQAGLSCHLLKRRLPVLRRGALFRP